MNYDYETTPHINPGILKWKLNQDHMNLLWTYIKKPTTNGAWVFDNNNKVIERTPYQEWALDDSSKVFQTEILSPAIKYYVDFWGYPMTARNSHHPVPIMNRIWCRISGKGEYQPLHSHQSIWTFIIWMNIPFEHEEEESGDAIELYPQAGNVAINYIDSIRNPIITEKATILSEQNKTVFKVHENANKKTIKKNIEKLFKVNVVKVNIINQKSKLKMKQGKKSIKSGYKKAIITLKKGQSIDLTTGI